MKRVVLLDNELKLNQYLITAQNSKFAQRQAKVAQNQKRTFQTRDGETLITIGLRKAQPTNLPFVPF